MSKGWGPGQVKLQTLASDGSIWVPKEETDHERKHSRSQDQQSQWRRLVLTAKQNTLQSRTSLQLTPSVVTDCWTGRNCNDTWKYREKIIYRIIYHLITVREFSLLQLNSLAELRPLLSLLRVGKGLKPSMVVTKNFHRGHSQETPRFWWLSSTVNMIVWNRLI